MKFEQCVHAIYHAYENSQKKMILGGCGNSREEITVRHCLWRINGTPRKRNYNALNHRFNASPTTTFGISKSYNAGCNNKPAFVVNQVPQCTTSTMQCVNSFRHQGKLRSTMVAPTVMQSLHVKRTPSRMTSLFIVQCFNYRWVIYCGMFCVWGSCVVTCNRFTVTRRGG